MGINPDTIQNLLDRRRRLGFTRQRLAEEARCSLSHVALFEKGYRPQTSAVLPRLLAVLEAAENESRRSPQNDERPAEMPSDGGHVCAAEQVSAG